MNREPMTDHTHIDNPPPPPADVYSKLGLQVLAQPMSDEGQRLAEQLQQQIEALRATLEQAKSG